MTDGCGSAWTPRNEWCWRLFPEGGPQKKVDLTKRQEGDRVHQNLTVDEAAAAHPDANYLTYEAADVLYHMLVMLAARDIALDDVLSELARRQGLSGIAEKAARG